ncbi:MAG: hypothetical protein DMF70_02110 [Acidobacteria bacterium]|nr:MAG: hypothetical protein DMF70_02110 [Acidobacteriota bacterium]
MSATARAREEAAALDLTTLRLMSFKELDALYRAGKRPSALSDLDGDAIGAMLAWRTPATGPLAWLLQSFGASTAFPWEGKTFQSQTSEIGEGINRVKLLGKRRWFRFKTRFAASFLDGQPTFLLDYSGPANPPFIRSIVDEVREVAPRLYLGPAALLVKGKPRPILFFAVSLQ